ncbi:arsenate reductase/protein-tyrosine-phosphatase family protein [Streptomyces sp. YIM S03343]
MNRVLFVCTGNVHRSVLAERLLTARLPPGAPVHPESAGTRTRPRPGMEAATRTALEHLGGDGSGFAARPLTARLVTEAALVLGLAREHREAAVRLAPGALRRCFTLKEFVRLAEDDHMGPRPVTGFDAVVAATAARRGVVAPVPPGDDDITDPWGRPDAELHACAREIDGTVRVLAALLSGPGPAVQVCRTPGSGHRET